MITVPRFRPIAIDPIFVGQPVSGTVFERAGRLANWLQAQGGMIIPWAIVGATITAGTTRSLVFRTHARPRATHRVWILKIAQASGSIVVELPSGDSYSLPATRLSAGPAVLIETLAARASAEETLEVAIEVIGANAIVYSATCYESTRAELAAVSDDQGLDAGTLEGDRPIYDIDFKSIGGLDGAFAAVAPHVRRWHFCWTAAHASASSISGGVTTTSGSFVPVFPLSIKLQGFRRYAGDTETPLHVEIFAGATGGAGEVKATTLIDNDTATVTATGFYQLDVTIAATDPSDPLGGAMDELTIEMRKTTGTAVTVGGVSAFEDPI